MEADIWWQTTDCSSTSVITWPSTLEVTLTSVGGATLHWGRSAPLALGKVSEVAVACLMQQSLNNTLCFGVLFSFLSRKGRK